jgi:hypothetical protein
MIRWSPLAVTVVNCSSVRLRLLSLRASPDLRHFCALSRFDRKQMSTLAVNRTQIAKRRSPRIALNAPVALAGHDRQKCAFTLTAKAMNLNLHGAAIQLSRELEVGSTVTVRNGRGTQAPARVVAQVSAVQGVFTYGIEFQSKPVKNFWGITFPQQA